jgi:hypothetical protein
VDIPVVTAVTIGIGTLLLRRFMVANGTTRGGASHAMMAGHVAHNTPDHSALHATRR